MTDAYNLVPVSQLGSEYAVTTVAGGGKCAAGGQFGNGFSVTATEDNTTVTMNMASNNRTGRPVGMKYNNKTYFNGDVIVETLNKYENIYVS